MFIVYKLANQNTYPKHTDTQTQLTTYKTSKKQIS